MGKIRRLDHSEERYYAKENLVFIIISMAVLSLASFVGGYHFGYAQGRDEIKQNQQEIVVPYQQQTERANEGDLPEKVNDGR